MEFDLSLNRSLEELISSYWEAENEGVGVDVPQDLVYVENLMKNKN